METFLIYIVKASAGIALFYAIYLLLLRNETFYKINRIYLVFGIMLAFSLPLFTISYTTTIPTTENQEVVEIVDDPQIAPDSHSTIGNSPSTIKTAEVSLNPSAIFLSIYFIGSLIFLMRLLWPTVKILHKIYQNNYRIIDEIKVIDLKTTSPFSFFNVVFIDIQEYSERELSNIIAHEKVHILERHWIDLLVIELFAVLCWVNPVVWLYERSIKQNHEYLADQGVLLAGYSPSQYQALLINQLMGTKVLGFAHSLSFSLNKKRMEMMKKEKSQKIKKLRLLTVLPFLVLLVFAFAERKIVFEEVELSKPSKSSQTEFQTHAVMSKLSGTVLAEDGNPLKGAYIILLDNRNDQPLRNTNIVIEGKYKRAITDEQGKFEISYPINKDFFWIIASSGYYTTAGHLKSDKQEQYTRDFKLKKGIYHLSLPNDEYFSAPPDYRNQELLQNTPPSKERANNQTMMNIQKFPNYKNGGASGLAKDIKEYAAKLSSKTGENGRVRVSMLIDENGNASDFGIVASDNKKLNDASIIIMKALNSWTPAIQDGLTIPIEIAVVVEF